MYTKRSKPGAIHPKNRSRPVRNRLQPRLVKDWFSPVRRPHKTALDRLISVWCGLLRSVDRRGPVAVSVPALGRQKTGPDRTGLLITMSNIMKNHFKSAKLDVLGLQKIVKTFIDHPCAVERCR